MKSKLTGLFLIWIIINSVSCRKLVQDHFPGFDPVPVVQSILKDGEPVEVRLSWATKIDTARIRFIKDAMVQLYANGSHAGTLTGLGNGVYTGSTVAKSSVHYRCNIHVPGYGDVTVSDSLPGKVIPFDVQYIAVAGRDEEGQAYPAIRFSFKNNPAERRYYEVVVYEETIEYHYSEGIVEKEKIMSATEPGPVTDPVLQSEGLPIFVFSNKQIQGGQYTMTVNYLGENYGGTNRDDHPTILEFRAVSYDYYRYVRQKYLYESGFEPEFGKEIPAINLFSNVENAYGIFAGYSSAVSDTLNLQKSGK